MNTLTQQEPHTERARFLRDFAEAEIYPLRTFLSYGLDYGSSPTKIIDYAMAAAWFALEDIGNTNRARKSAASKFRALCTSRPSAALRFAAQLAEGVISL